VAQPQRQPLGAREKFRNVTILEIVQHCHDPPEPIEHQRGHKRIWKKHRVTGKITIKRSTLYGNNTRLAAPSRDHPCALLMVERIKRITIKVGEGRASHRKVHPEIAEALKQIVQHLLRATDTPRPNEMGGHQKPLS